MVFGLVSLVVFVNLVSFLGDFGVYWNLRIIALIESDNIGLFF